jgi:phage FluMu gp28-like protein
MDRHSLTQVEWANGSRMICLPDSHTGVVGYTPTKVVIDEASRVSDPLYKSVRPMLALGAELELLSTPFGKRGFFYEIFADPKRLRLFRSWKITAD